MQRFALLLLVLVAIGGGAIGCGDSGPSGPDAKVVDEFEDLGLSREEAEEEVAASSREAAQEVRKEEKQFEMELREEEAHSVKPKKQTPAQAAGFTGVHASNYEAAKDICSAFPKEQIARELSLPPSADEFGIAEAYADDSYTDRFRQAGFEGCFDGLMEQQGEG